MGTTPDIVKEIPRNLYDSFTMNNTISVLTEVFDNRKHTPVHITKQRYDEAIAQLEQSTFEYYGSTLSYLLKALDKYSLKNKTVLIFGWAGCNCDAIAIYKGADKVYVVDYNLPICDHEKVEVLSYGEYRRKGIKADVGISISSFEHDGLGRYGDPIDPDGDLCAMYEATELIKEDGLLFLAVPIGHDCLVWNAHRIYGERRFPMLIRYWEEVESIGFSPDHFKRAAGDSRQPLFVLKNAQVGWPPEKVLRKGFWRNPKVGLTAPSRENQVVSIEPPLNDPFCVDEAEKAPMIKVDEHLFKEWGFPKRFSTENFMCGTYYGHKVWHTLSSPTSLSGASLYVYRLGRFSNNIIQLVCALRFAEDTGIKNIYMFNNSLIKFTETVTINGVAIHPAKCEHIITRPDSMKKEFITGAFFGIYSHEGWNEARNRYKLASLLDVDTQLCANSDIGVQIRSGDLFSNKHINFGNYSQPPLSFYTKVIKHHLNEQPTAIVHIIFQDFGNPVTKDLINYCQIKGIQYRAQQLDFHYDLSLLLSLKTVVFSYSTIQNIVLGLSKRLRKVYSFVRGRRYVTLIEPDRLVQYDIADTARSYYALMRPFMCTPDQLELMRNYSEDNLKIIRVQ